ncbi:MAG: sodium:proton antiporter [Desulfobacula sp. RIFOXYA12_FULL_46_16]|nr:MAG: sodium:proton antiporter [Deltaproteobacteria bacterium RIFOXYC2_FULL_48_10]OGR21457.1 MAG: sodium:proton antiporter [Desulfobacula sp. RIFOXYA12_FULL_46_16]OGR56968.1 MAG: sodium:proton antiporter [Desulfobacula sp. RIFOXYB2_FULL_45_6]
MRVIAFIVVCLTGALLLYGTSEFPDWGDPKSPASLHVSNYYIEKTYEDTHAPNFVTAVVTDYRGFDTMFETAVIFTAGLGCFLLLRDFRGKKEHYYRHIPTGVILHIKDEKKSLTVGKEFGYMDKEWVPPDLINKTVCRILIPFIQIYALYVVAHGDFSPGGGFQGGVIFGSSLILLAISYDLKTLVKRIKERLLGIFAAVGVLIYAGTGALCLVMGGNFLDYGKLAPLFPGYEDHIRTLGMLVVEIGVGIAVMAVMTIIYINIVSEGRHDEGL